MNLRNTQPSVRDADDESLSWAFDGTSSRSPLNGVSEDNKFFAVVYTAEQPVEVRYLGDALWLPATVLEEVDYEQPDLVRLRVGLSLSTNPRIVAKRSSSKQLAVDVDDPGSVTSRPDETVEVTDDIYCSSCFIRPLVAPARDGTAASHSIIFDSEATAKHADRQPIFYDAGAYLRGDYVEVRTYDADQADCLYNWRRGRVSLDRKNGTYDVRLENGADYVGIRGCHLRHHFRPRDVVDCRMPPAAPAGVLSGEEESAVDADGEGGQSSPSEDARAVPAGASHARQHSHGKHSHHRHHHHKHNHHKHGHHHHHHHLDHRDHGDQADAPLLLHLLPKAQPCVWRPAVVLKQEKSGLYTVSLQDGDKEKGVEPYRLMPSNRAGVRAAAEEVRALAQTWSARPQSKRLHKQRSHNHRPEPDQARSPRSSAKNAPAAELEGTQPASSSTAASSPSKARRPRADSSLPGEEESALAMVNFQVAPQTGTDGVVGAPQSTTTSVPSVPVPTLSQFDINDRVEVDHGKLDGEELWLAGRVEAVDLDRCTYIVRYADSSTDVAVPAAKIRRLSISSPNARIGGTAPSRSRGTGSESEPDTGVSSKRSGSRKGSSSSPKERSSSPRASPRAEEPVVLPRNAPVSAKTVAPGPPSPVTLLPPMRAPITPVASHLPAISEGMWLSMFNVALGSYEPCVVETVYSDETFDARNRRGDAYLRVDHRYVEAGPQTAPAAVARSVDQSTGPSSPVLRAPIVATDTPLHRGGALERSLDAAGTNAAAFSAKNALSKQPFRVGARVLAPSASDGLVSAVVVRRLAPEIYTVYLEGVGEEATFVSGALQSLAVSAHGQVLGESAFIGGDWTADGRQLAALADEEAGDRSLVSSLDDDSLVVFGGSIPAPPAVLDPAFAQVDTARDPSDAPEPERALQATRPSTGPKSQRSIRSTAHLRSSGTAEKADRTSPKHRMKVPTAEKPVSTKALRSYRQPAASEGSYPPPTVDPLFGPKDPFCTVYFRADCLSGQAVPIIVNIDGDVEWKSGTVVEVVFRSRHATFHNQRRSAVVRLRPQSGQESQECVNSSAVVMATMDGGVRHSCPVSVSFYLGTLVLAEVTIQVAADRPRGWHNRSAEMESANWAHASCPLRTSHLLLLCSLPQSSARMWGIVRRAVADSAQLLPVGWIAKAVEAVDAGSLSWEEIIAAQDKVQIVVLPMNSPRRGLGREDWLSALRATPLCERIVRAGLASVCLYGPRDDHVLESSEYGWLDSFGLGPLDLHTGGPATQRLWLCGDSASTDQECACRQRLVRAVHSVSQEMQRLRLLGPEAWAMFGHLLVLPEGMIRTPHREPTQHNEDRPSSFYALQEGHAWSVCLACDTSQVSVASSIVRVDSAAPIAEFSGTDLCAILPVAKAAAAVAFACSVAEVYSCPLDAVAETAAVNWLRSLGIETLLALHHGLSQLLAELQLSQLLGATSCASAAARFRVSATKLSVEEASSEAVRLLEDAALSLCDCDAQSVATAAEQVMSSLCTSTGPFVFVSVGQSVLCWTEEDARSALGSGYHQLTRLPSVGTGVDSFTLDPDRLLSVSVPQCAALTAAPVEAEGSPQRRLSPEKAVVQSALGRLIAEEAGVRDAFCANEAAHCLLAMGCSSEADFVSIGELFSNQGAGGDIDADKLRAFFHEGGIPLFIAAKLAVFVRVKLAAQR